MKRKYTKKAIARICTGVIAAAPWFGFAGTVNVADSGSISISSGDVVSPSTAVAQNSLPAVGSGPIFHLDASQTNGWTFGTSGTSVRKIPSLVGSRYLVSQTGKYIYELSKRDANNGLWNANDYWQLVEPELAEDTVLGVPVLDFGAMGSRHAMLFDYENEPDTFQKTNQLSHIGTVIAVYSSEAGGGSLLGGGTAVNGETVNDGRLWMRGVPFVEATKKMSSYIVTNIAPDNALFYLHGMTSGGPQSAYFAAALGRLRLDSAVANPWRTGLNGGWQIVSLMPTNALSAANGIGLGVMKLNNPVTTGGMKIAEMLIYGECLDEADVAEVERYLEKKWLSRTQWGYDGAARAVSVDAPSTAAATRNNFAGTTNVFDVAEGETLSVGSVTYGRGSGARIIKQGEGALSIGDLKRYAGTLSVEEGTFAFSPKATPASFPIKPSFHIDVSRASSITSIRAENGTNFVDRIESLGTNYQGEPLCAVRQSTYNAPFLRYGMFDVDGAPAPVLDFYDIVGNGNGTTPDKAGAFLRIARNNGTSFPYVESICTLVAVVSPRTKGGFLVGNGASTGADPAASSSSGCYFDRTLTDSQLYSRPLLETAPFTRLHPTLVPTNGLVMIDGVVRDVRSGYATYGFQVLALRVPASVVTTIGTTWAAHYAGGFMLAELALWSRPLTEEEMRDASAHLHAKWFHRALPGYTNTGDETGVADVQSLDAANGATIAVAEGRTMRVGNVTPDSTLSLAGGGAVEFSDGASVTEQAQLAANPSLDLDASDTNKMVTALYTGNSPVWMWFDKNHRNMAYTRGIMPTLLTANSTPARLPVVDMGNYRSNIRLTLSKSLNSVRSAYVVMGTSKKTAGGGDVFGSSSLVDALNANYRDFPCGTDSNGWPDGPFCRNTAISPWSPLFLSGAERYIDGIATNTTALWRDDGETYDLYEVHLPVGAHISGICNKNDESNFSGGGRIAEMVVYERALSAREKVATRNYLMKKWLGTPDEALQPLPAETPVTRSLAGISGDGAIVVDSLALSRLAADAAAGATPSVSGTVVLGETLEIVVSNAASIPSAGMFVPCVTCPSLTGLSGCHVSYSGDSSWIAAGLKAKLMFENGILGVGFIRPRGMMISLR